MFERLILRLKVWCNTRILKNIQPKPEPKTPYGMNTKRDKNIIDVIERMDKR